MLEAVVLICQILLEIKRANDAVVVNKEKCHRLTERILALEPSIKKLRSDSSPDLVHKLQKLFEEIRDALTKFKTKNCIRKMIGAFRNTDMELFADFNVRLNHAVAELHLDLFIDHDVQKRQDDEDFRKDTEEMLLMMQELLNEQGMKVGEINVQMQKLSDFLYSRFERLEAFLRQADTNAVLLTEAAKPKELPSLKSIDCKHLQWEDPGGLIGSGSFGKVFKAKYVRGDVAVKVLIAPHEGSQEGYLEALRHEGRVMQALSHPSIVNFFGGVYEGSMLCLVMELARCSLYDLLYKSAARLREMGICPSSHLLLPDNVTFQFSLAFKLALLEDCIAGLEYLFVQRILHR